MKLDILFILEICFLLNLYSSSSLIMQCSIFIIPQILYLLTSFSKSPRKKYSICSRNHLKELRENDLK